MYPDLLSTRSSFGGPVENLWKLFDKTVGTAESVKLGSFLLRASLHMKSVKKANGGKETLYCSLY